MSDEPVLEGAHRVPVLDGRVLVVPKPVKRLLHNSWRPLSWKVVAQMQAAANKAMKKKGKP